jgi:hypothetical protein
MNKQELDNALEQLHFELRQIKSVDERERVLLEKLTLDIQRLSRLSAADRQREYDRLGEGLKEGIELFEASHPRATMLMGQLVDALAKMGI